MQPGIEVERVSKKFCHSLGRSMIYGLADIGRDLLGMQIDRSQLRHDEFWSLDDVSFQVKRGECLGVVGANGAGKSTLLKLIAGVLSPDVGRITVRGRVGTLIEVGAGFHPMLTGRENIYVNGAILGMGKREIDAKFDEIVDFSGIGEFLDTPVKHYSSGMYVRLGFSVAIHTEPDVLLIDEALAVGDAAFRVKCLNRIEHLKTQGSAILFVSHSEPQIARVADRCLLLKRGQKEMLDMPAETLQHYRAARIEAERDVISDTICPDMDYEQGVRVCDVRIQGGSDRIGPMTGTPCMVDIRLDITESLTGVEVELRWWNSDEQLVAVLDSSVMGSGLNLDAGYRLVRVVIPSLVLMPDRYRLAGGLKSGKQILAWSTELARFDVVAMEACAPIGLVCMPADFSVLDAPQDGIAADAAEVRP